MENITKEILIKWIVYDMETGEFLRKIASSWCKAGSNAGTVYISQNGRSYLKIRIMGQRYFAHRLAWLYFYGEFPKGSIDHIDGNGLNNRIENLRDVSEGENSKNRQRSMRNSSGVTGVYWDKRSGKWSVSIGVNYKIVFIGYFMEFEGAVQARKGAERFYGFHENHGRAK